MFLPNKNCTVMLSAGKNDVYGQPLPAVKVQERCAVVKLNVLDAKSSIRADSSASRGNAHEIQEDAVILLTAKTKANIHDILIVDGFHLKIMAKEPRYNILGKLDHFQITLTIWSQT